MRVTPLPFLARNAKGNPSSETSRPLATSSLAVGRFAAKQGSLRSPRGRLVASLEANVLGPLFVKPTAFANVRKFFKFFMFYGSEEFLFLFKGKMYWVCPLVFAVILKCTSAGQTIRGSAVLEHDWAEAFKLIINVPMQYSVPDGWRMALIFSQPIRKVDVWRAIELKEKTSADKKTHALKNMYFNTRLAKGEILTMAVVAYKVKLNSKPGNVTVLFKGGNVIPALPTLPPVSWKMTIKVGKQCRILVVKDINISKIILSCVRLIVFRNRDT